MRIRRAAAFAHATLTLVGPWRPPQRANVAPITVSGVLSSCAIGEAPAPWALPPSPLRRPHGLSRAHSADRTGSSPDPWAAVSSAGGQTLAAPSANPMGGLADALRGSPSRGSSRGSGESGPESKEASPKSVTGVRSSEPGVQRSSMPQAYLLDGVVVRLVPGRSRSQIKAVCGRRRPRHRTPRRSVPSVPPRHRHRRDRPAFRSGPHRRTPRVGAPLPRLGSRRNTRSKSSVSFKSGNLSDLHAHDDPGPCPRKNSGASIEECLSEGSRASRRSFFSAALSTASRVDGAAHPGWGGPSSRRPLFAVGRRPGAHAGVLAPAGPSLHGVWRHSLLPSRSRARAPILGGPEPVWPGSARPRGQPREFVYEVDLGGLPEAAQSQERWSSGVAPRHAADRLGTLKSSFLANVGACGICSRPSPSLGRPFRSATPSGPRAPKSC